MHERLATARTVMVATGIVMQWDRVDQTTARRAIVGMAIDNRKAIEEVATAIICFAALGRRSSAVEGA